MNNNLKNNIRKKYTDLIKQYLNSTGEEALQVASGEISIPVVDEEGNEAFVNFIVKVPSGSRDGESYDGYAMAEDFALHQKLAEEKKKEAAEKKAKKIEADRKNREERKRLREAQKEKAKK